MDDRALRVALQRHWDASDANDIEIEHDIYREDAVLDYPQSGSGSTVGGIFKRAVSCSQTRSVLQSGELSATAISGLLSLYLPTTEYPLTR